LAHVSILQHFHSGQLPASSLPQKKGRELATVSCRSERGICIVGFMLYCHRWVPGACYVREPATELKQKTELSSSDLQSCGRLGFGASLLHLAAALSALGDENNNVVSGNNTISDHEYFYTPRPPLARLPLRGRRRIDKSSTAKPPVLRPSNEKAYVYPMARNGTRFG